MKKSRQKYTQILQISLANTVATKIHQAQRVGGTQHNAKRSEATKEQQRTEDGKFLEKRVTPQVVGSPEKQKPKNVTSETKAEVSKTNQGRVTQSFLLFET